MSTFDKDKVKEVLRPLVKSAYESQDSAEQDMYRNTIDVFAATIETTIKDISMEEWMVQEKQRQVQKTLQNQIGELHQAVLGTLDGVQNLKTGSVIDLDGTAKGFIAEVKNKHNTTKGNHKKSIYDDLQSKLPEDESVVAYYVEILPKNGKSYDETFTPSDNVSKKNREENERIRRIDGQTFYEKVTGNKDALKELYQLLPVVTAEILEEEYEEKRDSNKYLNDKEFSRIYGKK
ncbi:Eco47II family restriction endonuclease [Acinetobacter sp. YH16051]|uniref:Eco47II family restriction endonuclease n=1 Tax=Acinetobacter sp. YH16051 TaxID=2601190 RepID=UPI0015D10485